MEQYDGHITEPEANDLFWEYLRLECGLTLTEFIEVAADPEQREKEWSAWLEGKQHENGFITEHELRTYRLGDPPDWTLRHRGEQP